MIFTSAIGCTLHTYITRLLPDWPQSQSLATELTAIHAAINHADKSVSTTADPPGHQGTARQRTGAGEEGRGAEEEGACGRKRKMKMGAGMGTGEPDGGSRRHGMKVKRRGEHRWRGGESQGRRRRKLLSWEEGYRTSMEGY